MVVRSTAETVAEYLDGVLRKDTTVPNLPGWAFFD